MTWNRRNTDELGSKREYFKSFGQKKSMSKGPGWVREQHPGDPKVSVYQG